MAVMRLYDKPLMPATRILIILIIAVAGLFYVKWMPYYHKAFLASANHSIGRSILMGTAAQAPAPSWRAAFDYALAYGKAIWQAMVLGLLLGSALQEFAPRAWIARVLGRANLSSVAIGGLLAIPGMMCTCCAAPVVIGLRRAHASAAAATAFWLGNTVLNPATLRTQLTQAIAESAPESPSIRGWLTRFARLVVGLIPEYLILVLILGATRAWLFPIAGPAVGNDLQWIALMSAAGLLFVIPTAGEVPIVQAMLALGVGAGPAAALMMTLPPISLPSLAMTGKVLSMRVLAVISLVVFCTGIAAGMLAILLKF
jgi:uncharacterized protein